ncbi:MAG: thioesterase family protein [Ilumatobacteraceae bacterium]
MMHAPDAAVVTDAETVFDVTTRLTADPARIGSFTVHLDAAWSSLVGIHGGYLAALVIRAAQAVAGDRPVRTVTTSFLRPGTVGAATIDVEVVRRGRSITNLEVTVSQSSRVVVVSQVIAADPVENTPWELPTTLDLPPIGRCVPIASPPGVGHFDHGVALLDPADLPFSHGPRARVAGYMRPIESLPIDAAWLGMALDWFPPAAFTRIDPPAGGISISYTVHNHRTLGRLAADQWLRGVFRADISSAGIALEKGIIADPDGRTIAEAFHTRWTAGPDQLSPV